MPEIEDDSKKKATNGKGQPPTIPLQVPKEWSSQKRARAGGTKGRDTVKKRFKSETVVSNNSADTVEDICRSVCDKIGRCEDLEYELDFFDVLSHIDYKGVLEGLFGGEAWEPTYQ